jgi:acyl carrier protein
MELNNQIKNIVYEAVDELNKMLLPEQRLEKIPNTILLGDGAKIDSMAVVSFIVALEEKINDTFAVELTLADEGALVIETSPFRTLGILVNYLEDILKANHG